MGVVQGADLHVLTREAQATATQTNCIAISRCPFLHKVPAKSW